MTEKHRFIKSLINSSPMDDDQKNLDLIEEKKVADAVLSDCRIKILKNLNKRRMTAAELTHKIGIQKSAIYKHLDKLLDARIIRRIDDTERNFLRYVSDSQILFKVSRNIWRRREKRVELISDFDLGLILIFISMILLLITWFVSRNKWKWVAEDIQALGD